MQGFQGEMSKVYLDYFTKVLSRNYTNVRALKGFITNLTTKMFNYYYFYELINIQVKYIENGLVFSERRNKMNLLQLL